jgi:hypothetical protein
VAGVVTSGRQVVSELNGQISQLFACTRWIVGGGRTSALSTVEMRRAGKVKSLSSFHTFSTGAFTTALTLTWVDMVGGGVALGCCLLVGLEEEQGIVPRGLPKKGAAVLHVTRGWPPQNCTTAQKGKDLYHGPHVRSGGHTPAIGQASPPPTAIVASTRTRIVVRVIVFVCVYVCMYVCTKLGSVYDHCTAVGRDGEVGEGEEEEEGAAPAARRSSSSRARVA